MLELDKKTLLRNTLFTLIVFVGAVIRFYHLGNYPLGDSESRLALSALHIFNSTGQSIASLYSVLTGLVFWLFNTSDFTARVIPAITGVLIIVLPIVWREKFGTLTAFFLALFLAVDPSMVHLSRNANSMVLAIAAFGYLLWALSNKKIGSAGLFFGLVVFSGKEGWLLIISCLFAILIMHFVIKANWLKTVKNAVTDQFPKFATGFFAPFAILLLMAVFFKGSAGLAVVYGGLFNFFGDLLTVNSVQWSIPILALVLYEGLAIFLGLLGGNELISSFEDVGFLFLVSVFALVISLVVPSRDVSDIAWIIPVLLLLGALFASRFVSEISEFNKETWAMFVFSSVLIIFMVLNYMAIAMVTMDASSAQMRWTVLIGSFTMLAASLVLVTYGWSFEIAWKGIALAILSFFFVTNLGNTWATAHLRPLATQELWDAPTFQVFGHPVSDQVKEISTLSGHDVTLDTITLAGISSPSVNWSLKDKKIIELPAMANYDQMTMIVLAQPGSQDPNLVDHFRGKDITFSYTVPFESITLADWMRWTVTHNFPLVENKVSFWLRAEKFLDSQNSQ